MAELVNLRIARKRAKRRLDDSSADANRLAHGQSKCARKRASAQRKKAERDLDQHRVETWDGQ